MSAKLMYNLSDENPNLNKQFGCIDGIFQLFYRQHYPVRPVSVSDNVEKSSILATAAPLKIHFSFLSNGFTGFRNTTAVKFTSPAKVTPDITSLSSLEKSCITTNDPRIQLISKESWLETP
ncbi:BnaA01g33190D [Brassica napus]|uniref:BnaA01g33190D protein n=1 Tax=Brassica napus TaxID=3708 RepID=A0A078HAI3_BRANA|nr:BnaA01g33190D [Brassica napus]